VTRDELVQLRDALTAVLAWPQPVVDQVARWLAPEPAKPGNGLDHSPPPPTSSESKEGSPRRQPAPYAGKVHRGRPPASGKLAKANAGERKLLAAMQANPGASANALAKAAAMSRSTVADGLRRLAKRGAIERDGDGRWQLPVAKVSPAEGASARPPQPPPATS